MVGQKILRLRPDKSVDTFAQGDGFPTEGALAVIVQADGTVWIGSDRGLSRMRGPSIKTFTTEDGLPATTVRALADGGAAGVWVGTSGGLARVVEDRVTVVDDQLFREAYLSVLCVDRSGTLWAGTRSGGLIRRTASAVSRLTVDDGLMSNYVAALTVDDDGSVWAGGYAGLHQLSSSAFVTIGRRDGLADDQVWTVAEAPTGTMWFGTNEGLSQWRGGRTARTFGRQDGVSRPVVALEPGRHGSLWFGMQGAGLGLWSSGGIRLFGSDSGLPHDDVRAILEDRTGAVWVGTFGGGLARLNRDRFETFGEQQGLPTRFVHVLHESRDGAIWIGLGSDGGLCQWQLGHFACVAGLSTSVFDIHEDVDGTLWLATGEGLQRWSSRGLERFGREQGLHNEVVWGLLEDGVGRFWLPSNRGLALVPRHDVESVMAGRRSSVEPLVFGLGNGLRTTSFSGAVSPSHWVDATGRFWFATSRGVVRTEAEHTITPSPPPNAIIESVSTPMSTSREPTEVRIPPSRSPVTIRFTAPDLLWPERLGFEYWLEGGGDGWQSVGRDRQVTLSALSPGRYVFRVRAREEQTGRRGKATAVALTLESAWYRAPWFLTSLAIAGLAGGLGGVRFRERRQRARQRDLAQQVEAATQQVKTLRGLIPVCSWCRRVRVDDAFWQHFECYVQEHTEAVFSHGICPACNEEQMRALTKGRDSTDRT